MFLVMGQTLETRVRRELQNTNERMNACKQFITQESERRIYHILGSQAGQIGTTGTAQELNPLL